MLINQSQNSDIAISVIIPTLNAGSSFRELLYSLRNQTVQPSEIIVIDSQSDDGTYEMAQAEGAKMLSVDRAHFDHGGTRNAAAAVASGNILIFMTQDVVPVNNKLIEELTSPFLNQDDGNQVAYTYARQIAASDGHILEKLARANNYPPTSSMKGYDDIKQLGIKTFFCSNACSAIRRDVFDQYGGFISPVIFNEDLFMAARCVLGGMKIGYCADAMVYHTHHYSAKQQLKRYFDNGVSMRCNAWILPYAASTRAGSKLFRAQLKGLLISSKFYLLPKLFVETAAKLIGYKLGLYYYRLPKWVCRRLSMHTLIWDQLDSSGNSIDMNKRHNSLDS